jgi:hypothetical protein
MKSKTTPKARQKSAYTTLRQLCQLIPGQLVSRLAREHGVEKRARRLSPWSHVVALIYGQLSHALGLNDICDGLQNHRGWLGTIRGATAPFRNTLSHANKVRSAAMAEELFWATLEHLHKQSRNFCGSGAYSKLPRRFKRAIHAVDSTVISLAANCIDWARHRYRKAAAKCHMRLNLQNMLPEIAVVDTARENDAKRARELCAGLKNGEIVIFDKAYVDFAHLGDLECGGVFWVTRPKEGMAYRVVKKMLKKPAGKILRDDLIVLKGDRVKKKYPGKFRRVEALVEIDGKERVMVFITNNLRWSAASICDLYRCRWAIEVFFKQLKQTLQLCDFIGHNANAVKWQVWIALLVHVLMRYLGYLSRWAHSFTRLWTLIRGVIWDRLDLAALLRFYGTAGGCYRALGNPQQAYLPGMSP